MNDIVNCQEKVTVKENISLRVGPGVGETELTMLLAGEEITRIDNSGIYNFGGQIWDRVRISDGRQGFIQRKYLIDKSSENTNKNETTENTIKNEVTENQTNETEVNEIDNPNTNQTEENVIENPNINQTEENVTNSVDINNVVEGNNEVKEENTIGNETIEEDNKIEDNSTTENNGEDINDNNTQKYLTVPYNTTIEELEGTITKNGEIVDFVGTGCILEKEGENYIIIKIGDVNGDGYVKANDYLIIKDYIMEKASLENEYLKAADVTKDRYVKANDYLKIKDHIMYGIELGI